MGIKKMAIVLRSGQKSDIYSDSPWDDDIVCTPGETIKGTLFIQISGGKTHKLSAVELWARGKARTRWPEGESNVYSETEEIFRVDIPLAEQPITSLDSGEHHFEFLFSVPENLPPSIRTLAGKVKYSCKARAVSNGLFSLNAKAKQEFYVIEHLDLNRDRDLSRPLSYTGEAEESFLGECFGEYSISMERQGYIELETVHVYIEGQQNLFQSLAKPKSVVKLKQECICLAGKRRHSEKTTLLEFHPPDWHHLEVTIPETTDISIDENLCRIININHYIKLKSSRLKLRLPIVIGTVPISVNTKKKQLVKTSGLQFEEGEAAAASSAIA